MKIGILSTSDINGGSAIAAYRLHKGFLLLGHKSSFFVMDKKTNDKTVFQIKPEDSEIAARFSQKHLHKYITQFRTGVSNSRFSLPFPAFDLTAIQQLKDCDVINIHWTDNFISPLAIKYLATLKIPIFLTLHDQWMMTGGCHYSAGCSKFKKICTNCPQLEHHEIDFAERIFLHKKKIFEQIGFSVITPSNWLSELASESTLLKHKCIFTAHNGIDHKIFTGEFVPEYRTQLGIPQDAVVLLFGAVNNKIARKGFNYIVDSLHKANENDAYQQMVNEGKVFALIIGNATLPDDFPIPVIQTGYIDTEEKLAKAYGLADLLLLPSLEDNFPNQMLEAFACKTSVLAFETGGIPELVNNEQNGIVVPVGDTEAFKIGLVELVTNRKLLKKYGEEGRRLIVKSYTLNDFANKYIDIFESSAIRTSFNFSIFKKRRSTESFTAPMLTPSDKDIEPIVISYIRFQENE